ncbi:hypothetical protein WK52_16405 [Burkholderia multivorans]|nr:hypothetical protein WK52_16405 [Burkholderia multivorans]
MWDRNGRKYRNAHRACGALARERSFADRTRVVHKTDTSSGAHAMRAVVARRRAAHAVPLSHRRNTRAPADDG